jgi:hypothetical protein
MVLRFGRENEGKGTGQFSDEGGANPVGGKIHDG